MKKLLALLFVGASLVACSNNDSSATDATASAPMEASAPAMEASAPAPMEASAPAMDASAPTASAAM